MQTAEHHDHRFDIFRRRLRAYLVMTLVVIALQVTGSPVLHHLEHLSPVDGHVAGTSYPLYIRCMGHCPY